MHRSCDDIYDRNQQRGGDDKRLSGGQIANPAGQRSGQHVGEEKPEGERANGGVGNVKLALDLLLHAGQDVSVYVIDKIETCKQHESCSGPRRRSPTLTLPPHAAAQSSEKVVPPVAGGLAKKTTGIFILSNTEATLLSIVGVSRFNSAKNILAR